jgi:uncharacterized membrane protein YphA (DoxX/SURF4 family)
MMNIALWIVQGLLALFYLIAGARKVFQTQKFQQEMKWSASKKKSYLVFIGIAEMAGAVGLVLPMLTGILPWLTVAAAAGLALVQLLAIITVHIPEKEYNVLPMNLLLLALALFVAIVRFGFAV